MKMIDWCRFWQIQSYCFPSYGCARNADCRMRAMSVSRRQRGSSWLFQTTTAGTRTAFYSGLSPSLKVTPWSTVLQDARKMDEGTLREDLSAVAKASSILRMFGRKGFLIRFFCDHRSVPQSDRLMRT